MSGDDADKDSPGLPLSAWPEELREKVAALRAALIEGEESGDFQPFDIEAFLAEMRRDARQRS